MNVLNEWPGAIELKEDKIIFSLEETRDWDTNPMMLKEIKEHIQKARKYAQTDSFVALYGLHPIQFVVFSKQIPPEELFDLFAKWGIQTKIGSMPTKPHVEVSQMDALSANIASPTIFHEEKASLDFEDLDDLDDLPWDEGEAQSLLPQKPQVGRFLMLGLTLVSFLGIVVGASQMFKKIPEPELKSIPVRSIHANTTPNFAYASVSLRPARYPLSLIVQEEGSKHTKHFFVLFRSQENPDVVVLVKASECPFLEKITQVNEDPADPSAQKDKAVWKIEDKEYTFVGTLHRLKRSPTQSVSIRLPDRYYDLNAEFRGRNISFSDQTMSLRVGEKPPIEKSGSFLFFVSLLFTFVFGFGTLVQSRKKDPIF